MDNLEKFITNNRGQFDTKVPNPKIWAEIEQKLPDQQVAKTFSIRRFLSIAAAIVLLVGFGIGIGLYLSPPQSKTYSLSDYSPEYAEVEQYYVQQVDQKLAQLTSLKGNTPEIQTDLAELDKWMKELEKELILVPKSKEEAVINDIINIHKTKIIVLEKILKSIQSSNQKISNQNDTVDI